MSSTAPFISILIPTYNRARLLPQTLESVAAQAGELHDVEIIVSDDGSKDETPQVLRVFRTEHPNLQISVFHHTQNLGGPGNWAFLLEKARGEFVYLLSDDDWIAPNFLGEYKKVLKGYPDLDIVYSAFDYRDGDMKTLRVSDISSHHGLLAGGERLKNQLRANHMVMSSMYRTATLRAAGGWQGKYGVHLDGAAFSLTALRSRQTFFINKPLFYFRIGSETWSTFKIEKQRQHYQSYRSIIDDVIREARSLNPQLVGFLQTCYAAHAQGVLNMLEIKCAHGKLTSRELRQLLRDLVNVFPSALVLSSFYKMALVSIFGYAWLSGLRTWLGKPDIKNTSVFER